MVKAQRINDLCSLHNAATSLGGVVSHPNPLRYICSTVEGVQYRTTKIGQGLPRMLTFHFDVELLHSLLVAMEMVFP